MYETVGGFVFGTLGRVALVGDEVTVAGGVLRVVAMDGRRIERIAFIADPYTDVVASE
jgi:CBS domain containing-hemolysin-like protein